MSVFEGISLPKVIYKTQSKINGVIEVIQDGKTRRLHVENVTQSVNFDSPMAERMAWGRLVDLLGEEAPDAKSILVLGLGGGTMQHLISQRFPGVYIVSVEIDEVMVDVAKKFFHVDKIPNHRIIINDACRVIVSPEEFDLSFQSFNVVIVDIYCGSKFPDLGKSGNFLSHIRRMVIPGGLVIINRIYLEEFQEDVETFIESVEQFFQDVKTVVIPGKTNADNMLVCGRA